MRPCLAPALIAALAACGGEAPPAPPGPAAGPGAAAAAPIHEFAWVSGRVARGAQPESDADFAFLAAQGVRTVISVDGAKPDVAAAARHGLRYVHIPFGYDGVPAPQQVRLAKTVRELPGPVFVHCHHGRHRGPAAAVIAQMALGGMTPAEAKAEMERAGTDPKYKGLYASVAACALPDAAATALEPFDFPAVAPVTAIAAAMVDLDLRAEGLKAVRAAGWKKNPEHPDIEPAHEALLAEEILTEIGRTEEAASYPAAFRTHLEANLGAARRLKEALSAGDTPGVEAAWKGFGQSCTACHREFRDQ